MVGAWHLRVIMMGGTGAATNVLGKRAIRKNNVLWFIQEGVYCV